MGWVIGESKDLVYIILNLFAPGRILGRSFAVGLTEEHIVILTVNLCQVQMAAVTAFQHFQCIV